MKPRQTALPVVALVATLLAGCAGSGSQAAPPASVTGTPAAPSPSPAPQSARDELQAALALFRTSTYRYAVTGDYLPKEKIRASGAHDPHARAATWTDKITGGSEAGTNKQIVIGADRYRAEGGAKWKHLARTDATIDADDPDGLSRFAASITSTQRTAPHAFKGDLFVLATGDKTGFLPLGAPSLQFPDNVGVQFTAALDEQGRVRSIAIALKTPDGTLHQNITFSGYGEPVTISKPA
ncbi:hypothetical protein BJ973_001077 [Actinoplanes tereljensis]|uniref:Lipoprotein n=1 Tax=Paractinoplanes tereljensis TaxID=571912 RepID=A0A919U083_9ACTN|nr:hypothetical protein [Actinoplanes tereljensis]GIF26632.1 hypothetical protein Ate02nite_93620 [Actinoplanes tereljensis]